MVFTGNSKSSDMKRKNTGQYGDARYLTDDEIKKILGHIKFGKEAKEPGILLGLEDNTFKVDSSDKNVLLLAPPGVGKTKRVIIPTLLYNSLLKDDDKPSLIITDAKGELFNSTSKFLKDSGYNVITLNFRNPLSSHMFNIMDAINRYIDIYNESKYKKEQVVSFAKAEKYAKILANSIMPTDNMSHSGNSKYFHDTAKGLLIAVSLIVSQFGKKDERHLLSVLNLIVEFNGLTNDSSDSKQTNKLNKLFEELEKLVGEKEYLNSAKTYAASSTGADVKTSMNIFSSALSNLTDFVDKEMEQMFCASKSKLNSEEFVDKPTVLFLIIPDENTTRHFLASLVFRNMMNELVAIAEESENDKLKRRVIALMDEFGNTPKIKDFDVTATAVRSRNIRLLIALQSFGQLNKAYNKELAKIIKDAFQITIIGTLAATATDDAAEVVKMAGHFTATTYSSSSSSNRSAFAVFNSNYNRSSSEQLIKKNLIEAHEVSQLPVGEFIVFYHGRYPFKSRFDIIFDVLKSKMIRIDNLEKIDLPVTNLQSIKKLNQESILRSAYYKSDEYKKSKYKRDDINSLFQFNNKDFI